jgi:hypothetical protein
VTGINFINCEAEAIDYPPGFLENYKPKHSLNKTQFR